MWTHFEPRRRPHGTRAPAVGSMAAPARDRTTVSVSLYARARGVSRGPRSWGSRLVLAIHRLDCETGCAWDAPRCCGLQPFATRALRTARRSQYFLIVSEIRNQQVTRSSRVVGSI